MTVKDLMQREVLTATEDDTVEELLEVFVHKHIHGAPVLDGSGSLVGMVTLQDMFFGTMTRSGESGPHAAAKANHMRVRDIMTSPAVSAPEETEIRRLCQIMYKLRIHRVPIVKNDKLTGIISSIDICGAIARGARVD